ncbi:MAG: hypothetical protein QE290_06965 [Acidovorax sp.]|jgi:hypothetical protein|uniref:hypothetical protein n=1 Tax=Acidovorax sp. TaxID=1872122 RepID=UPI002619234D|nr:hypothetical protein [Acidovorax sp.]MDH4463762.1 hypothetical protein [Acidovorax sp.]
MTRKPWPFPTARSHPKPAPTTQPIATRDTRSVEAQEVSEPALDHAVEESFPASDPISVVSTKVVRDDKKESDDKKAP